MRSDPPNDDEVRYMRRALELAERGWGRVAPNPLVGAVVVRDGAIMGEGWHGEYGQAHAEVEAIRASDGRAAGGTMYVTLEPCDHTGKTPPCTRAILEAGIRRVVYGAADPHRAAAGGASTLADAGLEVRGGVLAAEANALNPGFVRRHTPEGPRRPWTELKLALSLDARIADAHGRSHWITGDAARDEVHRLRGGADAIAVGIGTALADDPSLTVRGSIIPRVSPVRVVFDRNLRLPSEGRLASTAAETPVWLFCSPGAPIDARTRLEARGVRILEAADLAEALGALFREGISTLFCEGGARIASALLAADLVDRLTLFYAPILLGPAGADPFLGLPSGTLADARRWTVRRRESFGEDMLIVVE